MTQGFRHLDGYRAVDVAVVLIMIGVVNHGIAFFSRKKNVRIVDESA